MSSGIAVSFRRRFGHVAELLDQRKSPGEVAILKIGQRFVYYLVSKELYMTKPVGVTVLSKCLLAMKEHCLQMGITSLAMPKIGCGRDHLQWSQVAATIEQTFTGSGIRVNVYSMKEVWYWH
jgi:O-acetyl-ADP-ribose deacetylase (regulator of RNase III)